MNPVYLWVSQGRKLSDIPNKELIDAIHNTKNTDRTFRVLEQEVIDRVCAGVLVIKNECVLNRGEALKEHANNR